MKNTIFKAMATLEAVADAIEEKADNFDWSTIDEEERENLREEAYHLAELIRLDSDMLHNYRGDFKTWKADDRPGLLDNIFKGFNN